MKKRRLRLKEALTAARDATRGKAQFNSRQFRNRVKTMQTVAILGPSGWRNAHIQMLTIVQCVLEALQEWCKYWAKDEDTEETTERARPQTQQR